MNETQYISSQADTQNPALDTIKTQTAQVIKQIEEMVKTGAMTQEQGLNLMNYVTQKAFEKYTNNSLAQQDEKPKVEMLKETPEFFNRDGRIDVFDYLKGANAKEAPPILTSKRN